MNRPGPKAPDNPEEPGARTLLKDQAYEQLKSLILRGVYPPATFLSERQLTARFGMSKTPVRSAIERLEMEGFLIVSPQQGIVVAELSLDEIVDHFEIRLALETFVVRRLAGQASKVQISRLELNLEAQSRYAGQSDVLRYRQLDRDFHLSLCECLGNKEIAQVMRRLGDKLSRVIFRIISQRTARMATSTEEHRRIVDATKTQEMHKREAKWGIPLGRRRGKFMTANVDLSGRLWGSSHGRRQLRSPSYLL